MRRGEIVVGTFTRSLVIRLAEAAGKFDAAGIRVVEKSVTSSAAQFASLEAGEYDAILTGPDNVIAYRLVRDNPLGRLMPVVNERPGISSPSMRRPGLAPSTLPPAPTRTAGSVPGPNLTVIRRWGIRRLPPGSVSHRDRRRRWSRWRRPDG